MTCGPLKIRGWTGCVIGQNRESYGVILFDSVATYRHYVALAERMDAGEEDALREYPPHRAINIEPKASMPAALLREIKQHRWPLASGDAFPTIMLVQQDLVLTPPCRADYRQLKTVALAQCEWLDTEPELSRQWSQSSGRRRRFRLSKVPAALRERVDNLLARITPFCAEHLNNDYQALIHAALAALARKRPSPLLTGRDPSWCAGVVHAIGTANFLFDPSHPPHCTPKTIYDHFGVASSTALNHSKKVRELRRAHLTPGGSD